ncbi:monooxygenase, partial [Pseudoalteromonas sp. S185]
ALSFNADSPHAQLATVKTIEPHANPARQVFLPTGPLAVLPLRDANSHSNLWSTSPNHCAELRAMDDNAFNKAVMSSRAGAGGVG